MVDHLFDCIFRGQRALRAIAIFGIIACGGCAADRALRVNLPNGVQRPDRAAVVFFVDGFGRDSFERAASTGDIPNIQRHILNRGARVDYAYSALPTITYANAVTFITGLVPGHHGIIANRWFDPTTGRAGDYCTADTYRNVDNDYTATTVYELLKAGDTVSCQAAQRRGATIPIDNIITAGINWGFENWTGIDCLVAQNFEEIADHATTRGRWPGFVFAYFPGVDHVGHHYGTQSERYRAAIRGMDRELGRICEALQQAGTYDRTYLFLVADHGLADIDPKKLVRINEIAAQNGGRPISSCMAISQNARVANGSDAVWACCGSRWSTLYLRKDGDWRTQYFTQSPDDPLVQRWLVGKGGDLTKHPGIELIAGRASANSVWIRSGRGLSVVRREVRDGVKYYRYDPTPADALGYLDNAKLRGFAAAGAHSSREWLAVVADAGLPDVVPQLPELFDSPRAGDIVFFAAGDWDFADDEPAAAHGSISTREMLVPMVVAGPDVGAGVVVPSARNCDVMPTVLDLLRANVSIDSLGLDGVSLAPALRRPAGVATR